MSACLESGCDNDEGTTGAEGVELLFVLGSNNPFITAQGISGTTHLCKVNT